MGRCRQQTTIFRNGMAEIKKVGFLITGEEIVIGDIQDTNSRTFSQELIAHHIEPGQRVTVGDEEQDITRGIHYLLPEHHALITIGGLGPTSDDRTRYGLAKALDLELIFHTEAWEWIVERMTAKALKIPPTNRQQALLPKGSLPLHNPNGTAAGCYIHYHHKDIFMLPGPPSECIPIFKSQVLPILLKHNYTHEIFRYYWSLINVNESEIADQLERITKDASCHLGYRVHYPYLEIKIWSDNKIALEEYKEKIIPILEPHLTT